jgi:hypothetical protein
MGNRSRLLTAALALVLTGAGALAGPTAASAPDPSKGSVSINAPAAALVGEPIVFKGRLSLRRSGLKVGLQRRVGSGWKNISQARTKDGGRYRLAGSVSLGGDYRFRVIRLPWLTTSAKSRVVTVSAYAWNPANTLLQDGDYTGLTVRDAPLEIDGTTYPRSIGIDADSQGDPDGGFFEVDLEGLGCAVFEATLGGLDANSAASEVGGRVLVDGEQVAGGSYSPDQSEYVALDIRGADSVRVEGFVAKAGPEGSLGVGTPRLLCTS